MAPQSRLWPDPRVKPPFGAAEIDWGHPLSQGLVAAWLFNEGAGRVLRDYANSAISASITDPTNILWQPGPRGLAIRSQANAGTTRGISLSPALATGVTFTWATRITPVTLADSFQDLFTVNASTGVYLLSSGKIQWYNSAVSNTAILAGSTHSYMLQNIAGSALTYYLDGIADGVVAARGNELIDGMLNDSSSETFNGFCDYQYFFRRALTIDYAQWLSAEPYAFLRPILRRRYFVPAAVAETINIPRATVILDSRHRAASY
jgi:hypothetical protein